MWRAKDLSGLLLLYSAKGSVDGMQKLVDLSKEQGKQNVAFLGLFLLGQLDECIDLLISSGRTPEAAFFARTYMPSRVTEVSPKTPTSPVSKGVFMYFFVLIRFQVQFIFYRNHNPLDAQGFMHDFLFMHT